MRFQLNNISSSKQLISGGFIMPMLALWIAFSCSRYFGIPKMDALPQITFERIIFVIIFFYAFIIFTLNRLEVRPFWGTEVILWVITIIAAISGIIYGGFGSGYPGAGINILLNLLLWPTLVYSLVLRTDYKDYNITLFLTILTVFGMYLCLTAVFERASLSCLLFPPEIANAQIEQHWGRSRGPFLQAEFNGTVMVQLIPVSLLLTNFRKRGLWRIFGFAAATLLCVGCYLTLTRAVILSLFIITFFGALIRWSCRYIFLIFLIFFLLIGVIIWQINPDLSKRLYEVEPITDRLKLISVSLEMISKNPLTGVGFGNFDLIQEKYYDPNTLIITKLTEGEFWSGGTHNTIITIFAELGILLGSLFLVLIIRPLFIAFRIFLPCSAKIIGEKRHNIVACSFLVCLGFIINAMFVELRYTLTPIALFWVFAAFIENIYNKSG
jgi:O-antigen ligase